MSLLPYAECCLKVNEAKCNCKIVAFNRELIGENPDAFYKNITQYPLREPIFAFENQNCNIEISCDGGYCLYLIELYETFLVKHRAGGFCDRTTQNYYIGIDADGIFELYDLKAICVDISKCECHAYAMDEISALTAYPDFYEKNMSYYHIVAPMLNIDGCTATLGCPEDFSLIVFDTDKTVMFDKYQAEGLCDPFTQTWMVSENDESFKKYNRMWGVCVNYVTPIEPGCTSCSVQGLFKDQENPDYSPEYTTPMNFPAVLKTAKHVLVAAWTPRGQLGQQSNCPPGHPDSNGCHRYFGGCLLKDVTKICTHINVLAKNASGTYQIRDGWSPVDAFTTITCGNNGKFNHGAVTNIEELSCLFEGCTPPCQSCDMGAIIKEPVDFGYSLLYEEDPPINGCHQTFTACMRTDDNVCERVGIRAKNATGEYEIQETSTETSATTTLSCGNNAKFSHGAVTNIQEVFCFFEVCMVVPNCNKCDMNKIYEESSIPEVHFNHEEIGLNENGCGMTYAICQYAADLVCDSVKLMARNATGEYAIEYESTALSATSVLNCDYSGRFYHGAVTEIEHLSCVFENYSCLKVNYLKCECRSYYVDKSQAISIASEFYDKNISYYPIGFPSITRDECIATFGCPGDFSLIIFDTDKTVMFDKYQAVGLCDPFTQTWMVAENDDSLRKYNEMYGICVNYASPLEPCLTCNMRTILKDQKEFGFSMAYSDDDPVNGCAQTGFSCRYSIADRCQHAAILGKNATGTYEIQEDDTGRRADTTLICNKNGKFDHGVVTNIEEVSCRFEDCTVPCLQCNMGSLVIDQGGPLYSLNYEEAPRVNGCIRFSVDCTRKDYLICERIGVLAKNATGTYEIQDSSTQVSALTTLSCDRNSKFFHGSVTDIHELFCYFEACM